LTVHVLAKDLAYPYTYQQVQHDKTTDTETVKLGFTTTVRTKPMIIDMLRASLRLNEMTIWSRLTLQEMLTFIVTEAGKLEAEAGTHDDAVMALALANYLAGETWKPIEVTDDFYEEAI